MNHWLLCVNNNVRIIREQLPLFNLNRINFGNRISLLPFENNWGLAYKITKASGFGVSLKINWFIDPAKPESVIGVLVPGNRSINTVFPRTVQKCYF